MNELQITLTPEMMALVPLVAAILQVIKRVSWFQDDKVKAWLPFVSVGVSLGLAYLTKMEDPILPSIIIGLVASGGYDLLKAPKTK